MKFSTLFTGTALCLLGTQFAAADVHPNVFNDGCPDFSVIEHKTSNPYHDGDIITKVSALNPTPCDARETRYRVTPELICSGDISIGDYQFAFKSSGPFDMTRVQVYDPENIDPFMLSEGVYDFLFFFTGPDGIRIVVKEGIEVSADMTVDADASTATTHIKYLPLLPDGSEIRTERFKLEDDGEYVLVDKGNVLDNDVYSAIVYKDTPVLLYAGWIQDSTAADGSFVSNRDAFDVWITPSEIMKYFQYLMLAQEEGNVYIVIGADPQKGGTYSNKVSDYSLRTADFVTTSKYTPEYDKDDEINPFITASRYGMLFYNNSFLSCMERGTVNITWKDNHAYICLDPVNAPEVDFTPLFLRTIYDNHATSERGGIIAPVYSAIDNYWCATHLNEIPNKLMIAVTAGDKDAPYSYIATRNPALSFPYGQKAIFGDNTPTVTFLRPNNSVSYDFTGRYGELRTIDLLNHTLSVECDGEVVCSSYKNLGMFGFSEDASKVGPWKYTIVDENLDVDEIPARTECVNSFVAAAPGGSTPTVMQMQIRDENGNITDRLGESAGGTLCLAAGAFTLKTNTTTWARWYDYTPLKSLKVEYAPNGKNWFATLDVEEDPSKLFTLGYGAFYTVDLNQVTYLSENNWYDVRISLEDEAGNTQVQTVSPAFRIEKLSGAKGVISENDDFVRCEGSEIIAPHGSRIYNMYGMEMPSGHVNPGLYIVRTPSGSVRKLTVR